MSALEAELNEALEDTVQLEERNNQLTQQLSALREKVSVRPRAPQLIQQEPHQSTTHTQIERQDLGRNFSGGLITRFLAWWLSSPSQAVKLDSVEIQLSHMVEEQKNWDVESRGLRSQLDKADEMVRVRFLLKSNRSVVGMYGY